MRLSAESIGGPFFLSGLIVQDLHDSTGQSLSLPFLTPVVLKSLTMACWLYGKHQDNYSFCFAGRPSLQSAIVDNGPHYCYSCGRPQEKQTAHHGLLKGRSARHKDFKPKESWLIKCECKCSCLWLKRYHIFNNNVGFRPIRLFSAKC